jgi:hypothetical protein
MEVVIGGEGRVRGRRSCTELWWQVAPEEVKREGGGRRLLTEVGEPAAVLVGGEGRWAALPVVCGSR